MVKVSSTSRHMGLIIVIDPFFKIFQDTVLDSISVLRNGLLFFK